jgi:hypothetical protein
MTIFTDGKEITMQADDLDDAIELVNAASWPIAKKNGIRIECRRSNWLRLFIPMGTPEASDTTSGSLADA